MTQNEKSLARKNAARLMECGKSVDEVHIITGYSKGYLRTIASHHEITVKPDRADRYLGQKLKMIALLQSPLQLTYGEIGKLLSVSSEYVRQTRVVAESCNIRFQNRSAIRKRTQRAIQTQRR